VDWRRTVALCKFVDAVLPQLTATQCLEASVLFRQRVEDVISITDDIVMTGAHHSALLEQTNILLNARGSRSSAND
jgi:hypothetical protein